MTTINKVAVIGAGTMGAGIAGQVANAGIHVWLLDLPGDDGAPNALAERGLERLRDPQQPGLMSSDAARFIHLGNTRDDWPELADCDWVAEAVVERLDVKQALYRRLNETCAPHTLITSNTSTIPIRLLVEGMDEAFRRRFAITHFFNPVRFMRLLELVRGEQTDDAVMQTLAGFCEERLGKGVVPCRDTPGFLANRVGVFAIQCALQAAFRLGLTPQQADALFGRPMGIPKTGVFGLYDLIGIDLMSDVVQSLRQILPADDAFHDEAAVIPLMAEMIARGWTGNKNGQGFYRDTDSGREVLALSGEAYVPAPRLNLPLAEAAERDGVAVLLADHGRYGEFCWTVLSRTLDYAASIIPEIGDDPLAIDDAMKLGYNWVKGPFELIDELGADALVTRMRAEGREPSPYLAQLAGCTAYRVHDGRLQTRLHTGAWQRVQRPAGVVRFSELRQTLKPQNTCAVASWYAFEGTALVEFHSKANALDSESMQLLDDARQAVTARGLQGLIVHNDAQHFSCGVNLQVVRQFIEADDLAGLDAFLAQFQRTVQALAVADYPTVAAPVGLAIGGGFEVVLHAKQVICHANSTLGLVESLVGLVPGGGGCKETLYRWVARLDAFEDIAPASWKAFMNLGYGRTAGSPIRARELAMLRPNDHFLMNRDRLLPEALRAIDAPTGQVAFERPPLAMPGAPLFKQMVDWLRAALERGELYPHDVTVGTELARIVTGGDCSPGTLWTEQQLFDAERAAFLTLARTAPTLARIHSMLETGSPIRN